MVSARYLGLAVLTVEEGGGSVGVKVEEQSSSLCSYLYDTAELLHILLSC